MNTKNRDCAFHRMTFPRKICWEERSPVTLPFIENILGVETIFFAWAWFSISLGTRGRAIFIVLTGNKLTLEYG